MKQKANPTEAVLVLAMQKDYKLSQFLEILQSIQRPDIFRECGRFIGKYHTLLLRSLYDLHKPYLTGYICMGGPLDEFSIVQGPLMTASLECLLHYYNQQSKTLILFQVHQGVRATSVI